MMGKSLSHTVLSFLPLETSAEHCGVTGSTKGEDTNVLWTGGRD